MKMQRNKGRQKIRMELRKKRFAGEEPKQDQEPETEPVKDTDEEPKSETESVQEVEKQIKSKKKTA